MSRLHLRLERSVQATIYNDTATIGAERHCLMFEMIVKEMSTRYTRNNKPVFEDEGSSA
jgi:hypothetical protein